MFWLLILFVGSILVRYLLERSARSKLGNPGDFVPPEVPAGTPIPVAFGTNKLEPIIAEWNAVTFPWDSGQAFNHKVTYLGVLTWGPTYSIRDIIYDEKKYLTAQGGQFFFHVEEHYTLGVVVTPPTVTIQSFTSAVVIGALPQTFSFHTWTYLAIFAPNLFGGLPPGEGGIKSKWDLPPSPDECSGLTEWGASQWIFSGNQGAAEDFDVSPPIGNVRKYGGLAPTGEACAPVLPTSGPSTIRYPRLCYAYFDGVVGTSPVMKKQEFIVTSGIGIDAETGDANPIDVLLAILTNTEWGLGISPSLIDVDGTFHGVEVALSSLGERFGISGVMREQKAAEDYIGEILRTVDAVMYRDPASGLLSIQLIRGGYELDGLTTLDESNVKECEWTRLEIADTTNEIVVAYTDRDRLWNRNVVTVQDHANIAATGGVRSQTFEFPYISTETWALKVAARELKANTLTLGKGTLVVTRAAWDVVPGDVVLLSWARYGLDALPVRVLSVSYGDIDDGLMEIEVVEDVYGLPDVPYTVVDGTWTDPAGAVPSSVLITQSQADDGTEGEVTLTILPNDTIVSVQFATESGQAEASAFADAIIPDPDIPQYVSQRVTLDLRYPSRILWVVTYTEGEQTITKTGEATFYPANTAQDGVIFYTFTPTDVTVKVHPDGGPSSGIVECKCVAELGGVPSDSDVRAATSAFAPDFKGEFTFHFALPAVGQVLYVAAYLYDADGHESTKLVQPIVNGGVSGTPGTVAAFHMGYTLASGAPTVTAVVNSYVTSVKFAADTVDFPSDATVRAATADSSAPFQSTFGTLTAGLPLYVAAFGYDDAGNESPKALLTILVTATTGGVGGGHIVINDGLGGFADVFDSTADEIVSA